MAGQLSCASVMDMHTFDRPFRSKANRLIEENAQRISTSVTHAMDDTWRATQKLWTRRLSKQDTDSLAATVDYLEESLDVQDLEDLRELSLRVDV